MQIQEDLNMAQKPSPFTNAVALWQLADESNLAPAAGGAVLTVRGAARLGVRLAGEDREESIERGGDGYAAELNGGYLEIGVASADHANAGDAGTDGLNSQLSGSLTICLRVKPAGDRLEGTLFSRWPEGEERAVDISAWHMPWGNLSRWNLGCVFSSRRQNLGDGGHVRLTEQDHRGWHDIIVRLDGSRTRDMGHFGEKPIAEIFIDGRQRRRSFTAWRNAWWHNDQMFLHNTVSTQIGAEPGGREPFRGLVDHVAIWDRALSDDEIRTLSGGTFDLEQTAEQVLPIRGSYGGTLFREGTGVEERCRRLDNELPEALADLLTKNPYFPRYHIALPGVVMNTHAICMDGVHHFFPIRMTTGKMYPEYELHYYGHLSSPDLVQWTLQPIPIRRDDIEFFPNGTIVTDQEGAANIIAGPRMHRAVSTDPDLKTWSVPERQPRIVTDRPGIQWRDTSIFRHEGVWYMVTQSPGRPENRSFLYRSADLLDWEYAGVFRKESNYECIQVFAIADKLVVLNAWGPEAGTDYQVGRFVPPDPADSPAAPYSQDPEREHFIWEAGGMLRHGSGRNIAYPEKTADGGFVALWNCFCAQHEFSSAKDDTKLGFTGAYALPQTVSFRPDGSLAFAPTSEMEKLRDKPLYERSEPFSVGDDAGEQLAIEAGVGANMEIRLVFDPAGARHSGVALCQGGNRLEVAYDREANSVYMDLSQLAIILPIYRGFGNLNNPLSQAYLDQLAANTHAGLAVTAPVDPDDRGMVELAVYFDGSIAEVYANGVTFMDWAFFDDPRSVQAVLVGRGGCARFESVRVWRMKTVWGRYRR